MRLSGLKPRRVDNAQAHLPCVEIQPFIKGMELQGSNTGPLGQRFWYYIMNHLPQKLKLLDEDTWMILYTSLTIIMVPFCNPFLY